MALSMGINAHFAALKAADELLIEYFSENPLGEGYRRYSAWLNDLALNVSSFYTPNALRSCVG